MNAYKPVWSKGFVTIATRHGGDKELRAYVCDGLAVHGGFRERGWTVTHIASGLRIGENNTCAGAKALAESLLCIEGLWVHTLPALVRILADSAYAPQILSRIRKVLCLPDTGTPWTADKDTQRRLAQLVQGGSRVSS
jgi:hypothetical protein